MVYQALPNQKINSLSTELSAPCGAGDTELFFNDMSVFHDRETGALITKGIVLGFDNATETYAEAINPTAATATSGPGSLTGCTRGVLADGATNGVAKSHLAGTKAAVMFTIEIYNMIRDDLAAHEANKAETTRPLDQMGIAGTTNTDRDANTTNHGLLLKAVAPVSAGLINILTIAYGETVYSLRALYDAVNPAMNGTAAPGTAAVAARRDHVHPSDTGRLANSGAANGKVYVGKADGTFALVTLTQGANVIITNADGAITIASTGGGDFLVQQIFS
jgi:hypothetical protein